YAIPNSTIKGVHNSFTSGNALENFFGDTGTIALGAKYAVGLSLFDIVIPVFTSPHVRFSIDWNLFDGEYYQFDWTKDTITNAGTFNAVKAGTRIGPSLSFLVTKKINAAVYYSARPGVQFVINKLEYNAGQGGSEQGGYYLKPALNYNLSNEVGAKIRFGKFMINPFYHFGKFTWKSEITTNNSDTKKLNEIETGYKFSYLGIRIGI
ncbi:MAG TPA: hypothetical protein PLA68_18665, partial [Panacibacter sp.]|nr:hypothetical protein [Panacibacter sp.]